MSADKKRMIQRDRVRRLGQRAALALFWVGLAVVVVGADTPDASSALSPGASLRAGRAALEAGANDTAARLFAQVRRQHAIVADHAARWEATALLAGERPTEAAARASEAQAATPSSLLLGDLARLEASARYAAGDLEGARAAWQKALANEKEKEARAALLTQIAEALEQEGDLAAARKAWLEVWTELPHTGEGEAATVALDRLDAVSPRERDQLSVLRARCNSLTAARYNLEALEVCTRARSVAQEAALRRRLDRRIADLLFRLRRYPEAVQAFGAIPGRDARFWHARSLARSGQISESIRRFEALGKGSDALAFRSRFLVATLWEDSDVPKAEAHYAAVAKRAPRASQRREASWRLGWAAYQAGRFGEAESRLRDVVASTPDPIEALRGRYWSARAAQQAGQEDATERLAELARTFPVTYYGWRAAQALGQPPVFGRVGPPARSSTQPPASRIPERTLERARILIEAGLEEDAARELSAERKRARHRSDRLLLANLLQEAGDYHQAQRVVLDAHLLELAKGPSTGVVDLWWAAWPNAYGEFVEAAVEGREVDAALLSAVMREESGYRPKVLSVVGARGLAQIMPDTGRRLAEQLGAAAYHPDELLVPERNLELAGLYLESLLARFSGRTSAAVASYNAGPGAVTRWIDAAPNLPDDEWVEAIPYDQTRTYVKRVLRSRFAYEVLY